MGGGNYHWQLKSGVRGENKGELLPVSACLPKGFRVWEGEVQRGGYGIWLIVLSWVSLKLKTSIRPKYTGDLHCFCCFFAFVFIKRSNQTPMFSLMGPVRQCFLLFFLVLIFHILLKAAPNFDSDPFSLSLSQNWPVWRPMNSFGRSWWWSWCIREVLETWS